MSKDFPDWVHPGRAASARRRFRGRIEAGRLPRLDGLVVPDGGGAVDFEVDFSRNEHDQVRVDLWITAKLPMQCQRSLETFEQAIESRSVIGVVASEGDLAGLPGDYEPRLCPDDHLSLIDLIEEEVLLSLPLVPVAAHTERVVERDEMARNDHPFKVLERLKSSGNQN